MATDTTPSPRTLGAPPNNAEFKIGWICVLKTEHRAALRVLDERYDSAGLVRGKGDKNHYALGRVGTHNIIINLPPAEIYGQIHASHIAANLRSTFPRVRFVLLVGIGGGAPSPKHDIRLGDVILGTKVVPYENGHETDYGFEQTGLIQTPSRELLEAITFLEERLWSEGVRLSESIESIRTKFPRDAGQFLPAVLGQCDFTSCDTGKVSILLDWSPHFPNSALSIDVYVRSCEASYINGSILGQQSIRSGGIGSSCIVQ